MGPGAAPEVRGGHVIVCGTEGLALRVLGALHQSGTEVVAVEEAPAPTLPQVLEPMDVPLVVGPSSQSAVLERAGAATAVAVVCAEDSDLRCLETALLARRRWPHLRVVAAIANASVGRALAEVTGPGTVLDVAALAAPSLVQACLSDTHNRFRLDGIDFEATSVPVTRAGSLRALYGDLVPLAVSHHGGGLDVCPGRDTVVHPGDGVRLLGEPAELEALGVARDRSGATTAAPGRRWAARVALLARSVWGQTDRPFRLALLALVALVAAATVTLHFGYVQPGGRPLPVLSAVYFTVETVATVGYGDFSFATQPTWLQIGGIVIIILGVSLLTTLFALLTNQLFGRSLAVALGQRRITEMRGHVVVIGLGSVGMRVVEGLVDAGLGVVVIERDDDNRHLALARSLRVPVVTGDASQPSTLDAANARAASAVAVLTSDDLTNLDAGLAARDHLGPVGERIPLVLRIFDRSLSDTIADNFGFRSVLSTSALAAPWFIGAALGLDILSTFYVERELFLVARLTVAPDGGLAGVAMQDLSARIRVIAIRRAGAGGIEYPPRRATRFGPGDRAYLIGTPEELLLVLRRDAGATPGALPARPGRAAPRPAP